jgi:putative endonuclease
MKDICCYILYSETLVKFYTGACQKSLEERIIKHNTHFYGKKHFTAAATDWVLFLRIDVSDFSHALRLERKIKSMKSSIYIQNLKKYPELVQKIIAETAAVSN